MFEEHGSRDRPTLYEYRPLVRAFVEARGGRLLGARRHGDRARGARTRAGGGDLRARSRRTPRPSTRSSGPSCCRSSADVAEACGGFDWDDDAFDRAYAELEQSLFGEERAYAAVAPLVGVEVGQTIVELGDGLRVRHAADGELGAHWPDAARLGPESFGRETDRMCVLELERPLPADGGEPPDAPGEIADAVTALRLATCGPIAAGPVLFERLDWRPFGVRPVLPIAATQPPGEPTRLDVFRGGVARVLLGQARRRPRTTASSATRSTAGSSRSSRTAPFRAEQLRSSLEALLGAGDGAWAAALRAAVLLGETGRERQDCLVVLRRLCEGVARRRGGGSRAPRARRDAHAAASARSSSPSSTSRSSECAPSPSSRVAQAVAS